MKKIQSKIKNFFNILFHAAIVSPEDRAVQMKNSVRDAYLIALFLEYLALLI